MDNKVELLGWYGGDKRVCLSAWQSTTEELGITLPDNIPDRVDFIFNYLASQKKKSPYDLLNFLAKENHGTPFEKAILDFQITGDLASHIHSLKHRLSAINGESARYKEFVQDKYYLPKDWIGIKPTPNYDDKCFSLFMGSDEIVGDDQSKYVSNRLMTLNADWYDVLKAYTELGFKLYHSAIKDISAVLPRKRAKESARYFLGYNTQLNYDWQMNFRSFVNIQQLRNDLHAQEEIHYITNTMLYLVENIEGNPFEYSLKAFDLKSDNNYLL